jgi:methyltransferase (TIGR00027 family)
LLVANALRLTDMSRAPEKRVLEDPFGREFLPPLFRVFLLPGVSHLLLAMTERRIPGMIGMLLCRTRYIDDALCDALGEGCQQVVNLGAGFDTRAYRIPGIEQSRVFEVDQPAPLAWKEARLHQVLGEPPAHVCFVPIDFDTQDLSEELDKAGFRTGLKTFFIWEAVTQYITAEAVDRTLALVANQAAAGSKIAFTYVRRGMVDGTDRSELEAQLCEVFQERGMPLIFGIDPAELEAFLSERDLSLVEHLTAEDYRQRYLVPVGRQDMAIIDAELMALARVN